MKNTTILGIAIIILIAGGIFLFFNKEVVVSKNPSNSDNSQNVQNVVMSIKNYNYYPQVIKVKADHPVRISLDSSVSGCLRSFTIPALGIAKNLPTPKDIIEFTPKEKGTYKFQCSMGMGYGTIIVE